MNLLYDYGTNIEPIFPSEMIKGNIACNPSCVVYHGKKIFSFRVVDYVKAIMIDSYRCVSVDRNQSYYNNPNGFHSYNIIGVLSDDDSHFEYYMMNEPDGLNVYYNGLEDVRLVVWDGKLYAYGTRWDKVDGEGRICIYELNDNYEAINELIVESPLGSDCEKNWGAIPDRPFHFVYFANPTVIVEVDRYTGKSNVVLQHNANRYIPLELRGNSPLVRFDDLTYIQLAHESRHVNNNGIDCLYYTLYCLFYDNELRLTNISRGFNIKQDVCEFGCGLMIDNGNIYLPYSEFDASANILVVPLNEFVNFLNSYTEKNDTPDIDSFYDLGMKYFKDNTPKKSVPFFSFYLNHCEPGINKLKALIIVMSYYMTILAIRSDGERAMFYDTIEKLISEYPEVLEFQYMRCIIAKYLYNNKLYNRYKSVLDIPYTPIPEFMRFIDKDSI